MAERPLDSHTHDQQFTESPEETIALTRRLLARSRRTLDGVDRRLSGTTDSEMADRPGQDGTI